MGIIYEDQNAFAKAMGMADDERHVFPLNMFHDRKFLSSDAADDILAKIQQQLEHSTPLADSEDMPISASLKRVFEAVVKMPEGAARVEPLHLLLALLEDNTNGCAAYFEQAGITPEGVRAAIDSGEYF